MLMESRNSYMFTAYITIDEELDHVTVEASTECPLEVVDPFAVRLINECSDEDDIYTYIEQWKWDDKYLRYEKQGEKGKRLSQSQAKQLRKDCMLPDFYHSDVTITDGDGNVRTRKVVRIPRRDRKWKVPRILQGDVVDLDYGGCQVLPASKPWHDKQIE